MNEKMKNYVKQRIKEAKQNYGIKYIDVANRTGISPHYIYTLTSSSVKLSYASAKKIITAIDKMEAEVREYSYENEG